uniref:Integrase catalytic domain-containing protein n=1 Tax=Fagus sylvatica TaxID=28930 RepID=A0A2N9HQK8_FAGSY
MAEEASKLRGLEARVAALETKFNFLLQFIRRWTEREEEKKKATISKRQKEIYPALSLSKAAQTLPTPRRPAFHIPRPSRTEPRQVPATANPSPTTICLADQEEDDYARQPEDAYRATAQRLQQRPDLKMKKSTSPPQRIPWEPLFHELKKRGLLPAPRAPKESTEAGTCQYHPGARDHNLQGCEEFKKEVAGLITKGLIRRRGEQPERDCMTIDQLRLSPYEKTNFQARMERIEEDFEKFCERKKEELGKLTPATPLEMSGPDPVVIRYVTKEKVVLQTASVSAVQSSEKVPSVVIQVPQPFPYQDSKKIPWNYGMKVISTRESQPKTKEEVVGNLTSGLGGITRSGRCYTPEELEKRRKEAGKAVEDPTKTKATEEEAADFLRIIKSSEYSIVKQLSKMPSHISVLSLLLASESHRKALLKVLNEAYVPEDITGPSFENMVTSILVTNQLTFSDDELPPEGRGHTKALYISVKTNDRVVSRSADRQWFNSMVVRAFDGTRREVLGEIDLPVEIGPQVYDINFQVLRIDSPYNLLLGRPWLHTAGAVPSSLHQKMKLIIGNQLVTILAEEPISIYNDGEIPYIDGCAPEEASFHSFEFVTVIHRVAAVEPRLSKAGIMVAKEFVKAGFQPGQEGIVRWPMKPGGKELQRSSKERNGLKRRIAIPHIRTTFPASAMFQVDEGDVDELALLFTEDLNVNAITTEGDSAAFPVHADQHEEIDLEDFLDEENLKGYRIDEETLDEDTWEDDDLPDLLPHLMVPRGLDTLELEIFCEHGDPESHLRKYREKMALHTNNEFLMISTFHESLPEAFLDRYRHNIKAPPSNLITTATAEEEDAGPMVEGLSIHTIAGEEDSTTTPPTRHCQQGEEAKTWTCVPLLQRVSSSNEPRHRHSGPQDSAEARMQAREASTATDEARSHFEDQGRGGKAIEGRFPKHSNLFGLGSQYSPGAEEGRKSQNQRTSYSHSWTDSQGTIRSRWPRKTSPRPLLSHIGEPFVYDVMPFGLKNAGATYQRAMVTLFHDMIHHEIEVYVDDMIAKSRTAQDHLTDLRKLFQRLKKYQLRLNPNKVCLRRHIRKTARRAFDKIKEYLLNPPILVPPTPGRPLILYLTVQEASMGCMLGQQDETGKKEQAIYYLSKKFTEPETRYLLVEEDVLRTGLGLQEAETVHALLHHLVGIPDGPDQVHSLKSLPLTGKIARWQVLLSEFDILFVARKAIKGQAIADYLADYPSEQLELMDSRVPRRRPNAVGSGIGAVLVSPKGQQTPIAVKLGFDCTNNMTEYEACIVGLQAALEFGAYELEVFGDSLLIVSQTNGEWQASGSQAHPVSTIHQPAKSQSSSMSPSHTPQELTITLLMRFATLASLIKLVEGDDVRPLRIETRDIPAYCVCIEECMNVEAEIDDKPWYYDIKRFIQDREYPSRATENEKKYIRRMAFQFFLSGEILYKRTHDATLLRCVDAEEANRLIQEMHAGLMGAHANGPFLARKIMRAGYYWLTMERDCIRHVQTCHKCQMYQNSKNAPPQYLHTMASPWPFSAWGMDVIGAITPKATTSSAVTECQKMLITDNASNLNNRMMDQLCQQFKIQHHNSAPYRPKMNGAVEAANKNVKKILSKMTETYKDWHEHLPYALCAYRTWKKPNGPKPRYEQLNFIDEKRLAALCHGQLYQRRIERAYNKKARPRTFQPGDLVLKKRNMALSDPRGKFAPSYEGPYVVKKAFSGGAIILADMDGEEFRSPINSDSVIKYHV